MATHAEEADSHPEKDAIIGHVPVRGSAELSGVQLMGQVAKLENQWHLIDAKQQIFFL